MIVICNYVFDSLPHDFVQFRGGTMLEGLVSVGSKVAADVRPDGGLTADIIQRMDNEWTYRVVPPGAALYPSPLKGQFHEECAQIG